jgi:aminoglycoside phosphotransferase (APT) family kinase protein
MRLPNPELERADDGSLGAARGEIVERIGEFDGAFRTLSGGHANTNVRIGQDRVLRIYRRDVTALHLEANLLGRAWETFRVPGILKQGPDYLLMEFVPHAPVQTSREHGAAVGRALAEIHAYALEAPGFLDSDAHSVENPFDGFVDEVIDYVRSSDGTPKEARVAIPSELEAHRGGIEALASSPVLLHGDYKASNVHWAEDGQPFVLDWEFAWSGPALADVGQLFRWEPPADFRHGFERAYRAAGGELPDDWLIWASRLDLINMIGLLERAEPGSRRHRDIVRRIQKTVS